MSTQTPAPPLHPAEVIQRLDDYMLGKRFGAVFDTCPMPNPTTLALLCLRRLGYQVEMTTRTALAQRNDDDNVFRNVLARQADQDDGFSTLFDRIKKGWGPEDQANLTTMTVYALRVQKHGQEWIVDGWGNTDDDQILKLAASRGGRVASHYTQPWQAAHHDKLEAILQTLDQVELIAHATAVCQEKLLQHDTEQAPTPSALRRRI